MAKATSTVEVTLRGRRAGRTIGEWLYGELRGAILEGRLKAGSRVPASRDLAGQQGVSRGMVVSVYERLEAEGYLTARVGAGTRVAEGVRAGERTKAREGEPPAFVERVKSGYRRPPGLMGLAAGPSRPFRMRDPAIGEFPAAVWSRLAARRARGPGSWLGMEDDGRGYGPLREAIAEYLGSSRGVRCGAGQVAIVSGVQEGLDLLARLMLRRGDGVWMEDPGYFGAGMAFENAGARIVPVPVDGEGISVRAGRGMKRRVRGAYVTPGHQFPLGMTMTLERRMELLDWAAEAGAFVIEDDYDSEYRFEGRPAPSLQSLDARGSVIFVGTFNKLLFPALRVGYVVLPEGLADYFVAWRYRTELRSASLEQAVLCDFIEGGHLGRHLRRMRELYGGRLQALRESGEKYLGGAMEIAGVRAGLYTVGYLKNGMTSREGERAAAGRGVEALGLDRFCLRRADPRGVVLGFGAFAEGEIRKAMVKMARALGG